MPVSVSKAAGGSLEGECRAFGLLASVCIQLCLFEDVHVCLCVHDCVHVGAISEYPCECEHTGVQVSL